MGATPPARGSTPTPRPNLRQYCHIENLEEFVHLTLSAPDEVRRSSRDAKVLLFYRTRREGRWVVAVARRLNGDGFLITAYQTDAIKEGETLWRK